MATKYDYYESGSSGGYVGSNNQPSLCVNFLASDSYTAQYVVLYGKRLGTFTSVTAYLYAVDGANKPTGSALATSQTIAGGDVSTSAGQVTFTFGTPYVVTSGTQYAIVVTVVGGSNYNHFDWWIQNAGGYRRGVYSLSEAEWTMYANKSHWHQVWGVPATPEKPINPTPANDVVEEDFSGLALSWEDGGNADTYDVYVGPSGSLSLVSSAQAGLSLVVDMDDVPLEQKIYWRIDATNAGGTTTGDDWNFDARPGKISATTPADEATGITLHDTTGSWDAPSANATSYKVLYGTLSGFLSEVGTTSELSLALLEGNFPQYGDIYYWRVDAINDFGTTQGDELWFTAIIFDPVKPHGATTWNSNTEQWNGTPTGENNMIVIRKLVAAANNKIWYEDL